MHYGPMTGHTRSDLIIAMLLLLTLAPGVLNLTRPMKWPRSELHIVGRTLEMT